jgi:integrase
MAAVIAAAGKVPGFAGQRNAVFFAILAETGTRVNALRDLDGADCIAMPSGRLRLFLHAKSTGNMREVELSRAMSDALHEYARTFNRQSAVMGWRVRIRLGQLGPVWRSGPRGRWSYPSVVATLRGACSGAGVREFSPQAVRRGFATNAAGTLPRHVVALAGGWQGVERLDDHYIQIQAAQICAKLGQAHSAIMLREEPENVRHSTVVALPDPFARTPETVATR